MSTANHIPIRTDVNDDGVVDVVDVAMVATGFGGSDQRFDLNDDGTVSILDVSMVAMDFGLNMSAYVVSGVWNMENGSLDGVSSTDGLIYTENVIWEDCMFTAKVEFGGDSAYTEAAVAFCVGDPNDFYVAGLGCWGHRVSISRVVDGVWQELAFSGDVANVERDVWYIVTAEREGSTIMLYLDGSLELSVNDSAFARGSVGIEIYNSHVIIDYVTAIGPPAPRGQPTHDVLYADGTRLRSPSGDEVILVGTQIDYNTLNRDIWFSMSDAQKMKSCGGVVFELAGLLFEDMMPQRGVIDQNWINRLDKWVSWGEQEKMYYVITFGNFEYKPWGPETPSWFLEGKYGGPWNKDVYNRASIDFWDVDNPLQEENRQAVLAGFQFIANRYKNDKYALFGLVNEPFCTNDLVNSTNADHLNIVYARFVERIVDVIRSTGAKQLIFVDKPYSSFYTSHFEPVNRDGIVWEDHLYVTPDRGIDRWKTELNEFVQRYVYALNKPFYLGEYAPYPYSAYDSTLSDWRTILREQVTFLKTLPVCGYSWHEWPFLEGEYYDYENNYLTQEDSDYILTTIYG